MTTLTGRPTRDAYGLALARAAHARGTCPRARVGCVAMDGDGDTLGTGYNGSLPGQAHCEDVGCDLNVENHCQRAMHAEQNLIARCAKRGAALRGATVYVTHLPCYLCTKLLITAGVDRIVYAQAYRPDERVTAACAASGVALERFPD